MATVSGFALILLLLITAVSTFTSTDSQSLTAAENQHLDRIVQAMIGNGDFRRWASDFLSAVNDQFGIPLSATLFIPDGFDPTAAAAVDAERSRFAMAYHIVPIRMSFSDLCLMDRFSRLPTLLPGNSILVTNNSPLNFTVDGTLVSDPDLFVSSSVVIHGVAAPLDFSMFGGYSGSDGSLANSLLPRTPRWTGVSASVPTEHFSGSIVLPVALAAVSGVLAVKIPF